ncbi:MAG TPA: hypothetical protein VKT32_10930 [Chthonomonadaceae bacterium]|nr:hypothetical protein [Chthonomonadaceae bacterium]
MRLHRSVGIALTLFTAALLGGFASSPGKAQTYDAASQFSITQNPNGVWSYGWEPSTGATFTLYNTTATDSEGIERWWDAGHVDNGVPVFGKNSSSSAVSEQTWTVPAGALGTNPGVNGENNVIRWTAPVAGTVAVNGFFIGYDYVGPTSTDVHVLYNSATHLFDGNINSYNQPLNFSMTLAINAGDTIDLNVGYGSDGSYTEDTTGMDATINYATVPILKSLSPTSANAGGPAFTLSVKGSGFASNSTVNWNGSPLSTTYVSPVLLKASVPASLIATAGKASVTVTTPNTGTSSSKSINILVTTLKLTRASLSRDSSGNILVAVTLDNIGYNTAANISITKSTLNGVSATNLPVSAGSIAAGTTSAASLSFPGSAGTTGQVVSLKVSGKFTGGTFSGSLKVTLP